MGINCSSVGVDTRHIFADINKLNKGYSWSSFGTLIGGIVGICFGGAFGSVIGAGIGKSIGDMLAGKPTKRTDWGLLC